MKKIIICVLAFLAIACMAYADSPNKDQGFIYGEITVKNGDTYRGPIRWGKEEAFWHDMFNSTKDDNEYADLIPDKDLRELSERRDDGEGGFGNFIRELFGKSRGYSNVTTTHQFVCRFGDIKSMKMWGSDTVLLTFKNGDKTEVTGGSNDIDTKIHIIDQAAGKRTLEWENIRKIEFMPVPRALGQTFGEPLYGTVKTDSGNFKGFIQWDHDECLSTDELDGDYKNRDMTIRFGEIKSIEKQRRGSLVTLHSGKDYYLTGSNDVNDGNRGIIINDLQVGKVLVDWDEFIGVEFEKTPGTPIPGYDDFIESKTLSGTVETKDGKTYSGRIVYDIDEALDFELISGEQKNIQYNLPIRNIAVIEPLKRCCSRITLKNGQALELEDSRDVDKDNAGLLVWEEDEPVYVPWQKVEKIKFN